MSLLNGKLFAICMRFIDPPPPRDFRASAWGIQYQQRISTSHTKKLPRSTAAFLQTSKECALDQHNMALSVQSTELGIHGTESG